ncbi:hypothetical protein PLICRDRAFT_54036 [Plicaturopsis crispa FD-325 SS-3]|nr:hypothetical protein PLICRDRAFT_54036 [Plicaturopsis crispa FD-325 SS-3]
MTDHKDKLFGKKVVVIGASSGMGFGVAKAVLAVGAHVVVSSSNKGRIESAVARLQAGAVNGQVQGLQLEGLDEVNMAAFFKKVGSFDHLVYTAGDAPAILPLLETSIDRLKQAFDVRIWGAISAVKAAHPYLNAQGSITLTAGVSAYRPAKNWSVIAAGMGALETLTRGLAVDLAPVRVNLVVPGMTRTEMWDAQLDADAQAKMYEAFAEKALVKRVGEAEDMAEAYLYFMRAEFATGTSTVVDGGLILV